MSTQREAAISTQDKTKELVIDALFIALTFAATMFINIRLPLMGNAPALWQAALAWACSI